jgi:hypothetical protein
MTVSEHHAEQPASQAPEPKKHYTDADAEEFHAAHNWRRGCQLARTAGSATLECDTHHASLTLDIPVILRDI